MKVAVTGIIEAGDTAYLRSSWTIPLVIVGQVKY